MAERRLVDINEILKHQRIRLGADYNEEYRVACVDVETINRLPIIDAVEIVRCRECEHHHWEQEPCHGKTVHYCDLPHMKGIEVFKEFFCYYGRIKDR